MATAAQSGSGTSESKPRQGRARGAEQLVSFDVTYELFRRKVGGLKSVWRFLYEKYIYSKIKFYCINAPSSSSTLLSSLPTTCTSLSLSGTCHID